MNRRQFLEVSVIGVATVAAAGLAAAEVRPGSARIPIGFLGASYSHAPGKIKLMPSSPDWEFVGVCDSSAAGRQTCEELGAKLVSEEELFTRAQVVAVE